MSLIEEALRKQQQETADATGDAGAMPPPSAPPVPPPVAETKPRGSVRKTWLLLVVLGVLFLVLAGVVVWSFYAGLFILRHPAESAMPPAVSPAAATTAVVAASGTTDAVVAVSTGTVTDTVGSVETYMDTPPEPSVVSTSAPPTVAEPTMTASTAVTAAPPAPAPSVKELVLWPHLVVSGLMGDSRGVRGTAIINGQLVNVGETIEGAKVVAVTRAGVTLSYGGETRTLKIGDSTE